MAANELVVQFKEIGLDQVNAKMDQYNARLTKMVVTTNKAGQEMATATGRVRSGLDDQAKATDNVRNATNRATHSQGEFFAHIAKTTVQSALVNKLFLELVDVSGQAIKQVDLMENFPVTMASMGQSMKSSNEALQVMRDYVGQIGGNLGDATSYITRFTGATGNVKAATAIFVGLNNALIAGDSSLEEQRGAILQFAQALERGKIEAKEWNILTQNMSFQLNQVAKSMGYVDSTDLRRAMVEGEESMASFVTALTKMSTGMGPIVSQAEARMNGMEFAFNRMKNAAVQGLSAVVAAIGRQNIVSFFTFMTQVVQVLATAFVRLIRVIITLLNLLFGLFGLPKLALKDDIASVAESLGDGSDNAGDLADGLGDAGKEAKKLNKSLASFDKMNVLADKESGSGGKEKDASGAGSGFNTDQISVLEDLFDGIGDGLQEVSKWAKIFAGVLLGIAGIKFAEGIINQVDGIGGAFKKALAPVAAFKSSLLGSTDKAGTKVDGLAQKIGKLPGVIFTGFAGVGAFLLNPWVLLAAAIIAVVGAMIYLYNTNENFKKGFDSVWGPAIESFKEVAKIVGGTLVVAFNFLKKKFEEFVKPILPKLQPVIEVFKSIVRWVKEAADKLGLLNTPMETLGKVVGAVAAILAGSIVVALLALVGIVVTAIGIVVAVIAGLIFIVKEIWKNWQETWTKVNAVAQTAWQKMQKIWDGITEFFIKLWDGVKKVFNSVSTFLSEWGLTILAVILWPLTLITAAVIVVSSAITSAFMWAWDEVVKIWDKGFAFFTGVWNSIVETFNKVEKFFTDTFTKAWDAIKLVWSIVSDWFLDTVWTPIVTVFTPVAEWFKEKFDLAWTNVKLIWGNLGTYFKDRWENLKTNLSGIAQWFGDTFQNAWNKITGIFSELWSWFKTNVWDKITSLFTGAGTGIGEAVSNAFRSVVNTMLTQVVGVINGFISGLNSAIRTINKVSPKNINEIPSLPVPQLARGGIINQATLAMIGENGSEAVVPLENNLEWIDKLASKINSGGQSNTGSDMIPVTNRESQPSNHIEINVSGVFATSTQEQRRIADIIAKQIENTLKSKGLRGAY